MEKERTKNQIKYHYIKTKIKKSLALLVRLSQRSRSEEGRIHRGLKPHDRASKLSETLELIF